LSSHTPPESVRVLLVENHPDDIAQVRAVLGQAVARSFTVVTAPEARTAMTELGAHAYDIVLLGLSRSAVQSGDGFAVIRQLGRTAPVVVLGALDDEDLAVKAVNRGAQDYLVKERLTADLLVRSIRYARERHRLLADQTRRLAYELKVAAFVQQSFLPATVPKAPGHDIGAHLHASGQVGGDFYDFIDLPPDRVAVAVGDASGKGIPGAILMAETQGVLRAEAATCATPVELVRTLNRALLHDQDQDRFVTLFYGVLAFPTGRFTFVNAGHPRALLLDGATESALVSTGPPLRLFADAAWDEQTVTLGAGARLVIYSDGVTEAQNDSELFFDLGGVRAVMSEHLDCPAAELAKHICHAAERFERGNPDPGDDKTVVVVRALKP
jgi:serine phosphatase RsbU (regulator of sigma subunit)